MYEINIFDKIKMQLDWAMVYYGIKNDILNIDIAQEFACRKLECDDQLSAEELELSWNSSNRLDVLELIKRILETQGNVQQRIECAKDKIRIAIIVHLRETEKDKTKLLEQIDMVYAELLSWKIWKIYILICPMMMNLFLKVIQLMKIEII